MALRRCSVISCVAARRRGRRRERRARQAGTRAQVRKHSGRRRTGCFLGAEPPRRRAARRRRARRGLRTHVEGAAVVFRHHAAAVICLLQRFRGASLIAQAPRLERARLVRHNGAQRRRQRSLLHGAGTAVQKRRARRTRRRSRGRISRLAPWRHSCPSLRTPHAPGAAAAAARAAQRRRRHAAAQRGAGGRKAHRWCCTAGAAPRAGAALARAAGHCRRAGRRRGKHFRRRHTRQDGSVLLGEPVASGPAGSPGPALLGVWRDAGGRVAYTEP